MVAASLRTAVYAVLLLLTFAVLYQQHQNFHCLPTKGDLFSSSSEDHHREQPDVSATTTSSAQLQCFQQSLGFFDDIPNDTWERMRRKASDFVQFQNPQNPEVGIENSFMWNLNNLEPSFTCPHVQRMGGHGDGPKWTCDPHRLIKRPDCLIYSFGSAGQYEFEDSHVKLLGNKHCEIHVFDPGNYARPNDPTKNNIHYHQWGLKKTGDTSPERSSTLFVQTGANAVQEKTFLTFAETLGRLGHQNRTIDIFKLDCEGCVRTTTDSRCDRATI
jgi:Methyltransferase domain